MKKKTITIKYESEADKLRLLQAEELLKKAGYVYDDEKKGWVKGKNKTK